MEIKKISTVKEHYKYLRSGKRCLWGQHIRVNKDYATEANTDEHKQFVQSFIELLVFTNIKEYFTEVKIGDERRCDLLILLNNGNKLCVECQLSRLSRKDLYNRTFYYLHKGYNVMWVLPDNYHEYIYTRLIRYCEHLGYLCRIRCIDVGIEYYIIHKEVTFNKHKVKIGN